MDHVVYRQQEGKMVKVAEPLGFSSPNHYNFLITWREMDWSGFRTLGECEAQFSELESSSLTEDTFAVVER